MTNDVSTRYLLVKRKLFDKVYADLNPRQREAVFATEGPLLVIAGAGSGKTTVLVRRIAQIIRYGSAYESDRVPEDLSRETVEALEGAAELPADEIRPILDEFTASPCPPWAMLAITFTNKAANEIKARLSAMFDDPTIAGSIWAGTFHAICMRIIRANAGQMGYAEGVTIYDTDDTKRAIGAVMKELNIDEKQFPIKSLAGEISRAKEQMLTPGAYAEEHGGGFREKITARVYEAYQKHLVGSNALDFDDIIMQTVLFLRENEEARRYYAHKFRYICVDEYQDTNRAQFELCRLLASEWGNIMVVGDDDQSIYRFRGATVENILGFDETYKNARVIKLEQNYRSTQTILNAANSVIDQNSKRRKKTLWTENGVGDLISLEEIEDENAEARRVADIVLRDVSAKRRTYRDFAVLYRVNAQSNSIERALARSGIPYRICGGTRFTDRKEIRDVVAYLQVINNPADRIRLKRIINEPKRKIGEKTIEAIEALADENGTTMMDIMEHAARYTALSRASLPLTEFALMIGKLREMLDGGCPLDAFVSSVVELSGYRKMLVDGGEPERDRLDNVDEFISNVMTYMKENPDPTLTGFLEDNALVADVDKYDETADAVVLMTIHSAKGLEFPVCILPGMEEGLFPGTQSLLDPSELEEERRLAYVAITRAKEKLYILHTQTRLLYGRTLRNPVSRFVEDIPAGYLQEKKCAAAGERSEGYPGYGGGWGGPRVYVGGESAARPVSPAEAAQNAQRRRLERLSSDTLTVGRPGGAAPAGASSAASSFAPGDRVVHPTFGGGQILSVKPMGKDTLYEVMFDTAGTKKLMATYAKLRKE